MSTSMLPRHEQFIRERQYLNNVTPATVSWYRHCFRWLPTEEPTQRHLNDMVLRMRESGNKITGCNSVIRCINTYCHWLTGTDRSCGAGCTHPRLSKLREPRTVLPTFTEEQVKLLVRYRPPVRNQHQRKLHLLVLFLFDTGARITEALTLHVQDIDFNNLLVTLDGKGRKQRIVPFSPELRRPLFRWIQDQKLKSSDRAFGTSVGTLWSRHNVLRNIKTLCSHLGFEPPARTTHALRHTYATNYLRRGGNVFLLQRSLGHNDLSTTRAYIHMETADLTTMHHKVSLLSDR